jgi:hypothetical protein
MSENNDNNSEGLKSQLAEMMKKVVMTGVGAIFLSEETIRNYLGKIELPKELWNGLIENANKTKKEFLVNFSKEAANILSQIDFAKEAQRFFEGQTMKINIEISFEKKNNSN